MELDKYSCHVIQGHNKRSSTSLNLEGQISSVTVVLFKGSLVHIKIDLNVFTGSSCNFYVKPFIEAEYTYYDHARHA